MILHIMPSRILKIHPETVYRDFFIQLAATKQNLSLIEMFLLSKLITIKIVQNGSNSSKKPLPIQESGLVSLHVNCRMLFHQFLKG